MLSNPCVRMCSSLFACVCSDALSAELEAVMDHKTQVTCEMYSAVADYGAQRARMLADLQAQVCAPDAADLCAVHCLSGFGLSNFAVYSLSFATLLAVAPA